MTFNPKNDVKKHLLTHDRYGRPLYHALNQPGAIGIAGKSAQGNTAHLIPVPLQSEDAELPFSSAIPFLVPALSKSVSK